MRVTLVLSQWRPLLRVSDALMENGGMGMKTCVGYDNASKMGVSLLTLVLMYESFDEHYFLHKSFFASSSSSSSSSAEPKETPPSEAAEATAEKEEGIKEEEEKREEPAPQDASPEKEEGVKEPPVTTDVKVCKKGGRRETRSGSNMLGGGGAE